MDAPPDTDAGTGTAPLVAVRGTRAWTLWSADGAVDVEVEAVESATVADVLAALADDPGLPAPALWAGSAPLLATTPLSAPTLRHGAVLGLGRPGPPAGHDVGSAGGPGALELQVVGGPDAGRAFPLGQGDVVLGRGTAVGFALTDPDVSRRHAVVSVRAGQVTVADLDSYNGSLLRTPAGTVALGAQPRVWAVGATLLIGAGAVRLSGPRGAPLDCTPAAAGRVQVRPLRTRPVPDPEVTLRVPPAPPTPSRRRLSWVAVALPAVGGLLMAWLLATPQFLFFALLSPVVAVATWLSDRVSGHRESRRSGAAHAVALAGFDEDLASAVGTAVAALDEAHPDPARLAAAVRRRSSPLWARTRTSSDLLVVRLGTGRGRTSVTRVEIDGSRVPVTAEHLPVTVDLAAIRSLAVVGPRAPVSGVARTLLIQLTALAPPGDLRVVIVTAPERLAEWRWTRWLPHATTVVHPAGLIPRTEPDPEVRLSERLAEAAGAAPTTVVLLDTAVDPESAALLCAGEGVVVVAIAPSESALAMTGAACLTVTGETGARGRLRLPGPAPVQQLALDTVPEPVAATTARALATLAPPAATAGLPDTVALVDVPSGGLQVDPGTGQTTGRWDRRRSVLICSPGHTEQGVLALDLCAQGPHLLVAGTTGSGKSELLQTLVAGLALHHPPDRVSFLLVDYKGGAAFAEAAGLPHTVGMLTDLDPQSTVRALRSLAAELTRRERLLADHGVRDVADLPAAVPLARLVIVVDEFATLAEELPGFVSGLVGIAQRGRSLGVHLVLATQRPSGVVSPEIRANCSLRVCLRTTDESDSRDVLGTSLAASLPVSRPGRAYLRAGSAPPLLLQAARVGGRSAPTRSGVGVRRLPWPAAGPADPPATSGDGPTDLARLAGALRRRAQAEQMIPPGRPWLPPLPDRLPAEDLDPSAPAGARRTQLRIGLLDSPDTQSQEPLVLDLATGGGWLAVGGPRSGRTTALRAVLAEAAHQLSPEDLQTYVLDHGGGTLAAAAAQWPHTGTTVGRDDPYRTVRLLARLQAEVDSRRAQDPAGEPALLLLIDGYESLAAQLDEAEPGTGSAVLLRLVRDGAAAGLTCVLTAERAVPGSRVAAAMVTRLVLPLPDRADYAVAGIGPRAVPASRPPGRALVGEDAVECQLALPRTAPIPDAARPRLPGAGSAVRVVELPADPHLDLPPAPTAGAGGPLWLPVGPGDDDGRPVGVDLARSGGLLVVGPAGSGRTSALAAFARHCLAAGARVLHFGSAAGPLSTGSPMSEPTPGAAVGDRIPATDAAGLRNWAAAVGGHLAVVVVDDVGALPDPVADALSSLGRPGGELIVLAAASAPDLAGAFRGPTVALRRSRTVLLLRPAPGDAELLGLRVPRTPPPARPGAGWLLSGGAVTRVQVARLRGPAPVPAGTGADPEDPGEPAGSPGPRAGQSSSRAGPISWVAYQASS